MIDFFVGDVCAVKEDLQGKNVLLVEDEDNIRRVMKLYLNRAGFEVLEARDGNHARTQFLRHDPSFVILDLLLPGGGGKSLCEWIRHDLKSTVPIMIVSAKCGVDDRIAGLKKGADDFLAKPFSPGELVARVETVMRRTAGCRSEMNYHGLSIRPIKGEVRFKDAVIDLTLLEYKLLLYFMMNVDQIATKEQIAGNVYGNSKEILDGDTIDADIKSLRNKIGEHSAYPFIESVNGTGYKFNGS